MGEPGRRLKNRHIIILFNSHGCEQCGVGGTTAQTGTHTASLCLYPVSLTTSSVTVQQVGHLLHLCVCVCESFCCNMLYQDIKCLYPSYNTSLSSPDIRTKEATKSKEKIFMDGKLVEYIVLGCIFSVLLYSYRQSVLYFTLALYI